MTHPNCISARLKPGTPRRLGAHYDGNGTNFAVFSENASQMYLCLFSADGQIETARISLAEKTGSVWHGYMEDIEPGALYGYRADGSYAPEQGHRFNVNKLLLDPYTREIHGTFDENPALFGFEAGSVYSDLSFNTMDSAPFMPKSVVPDPDEFAPAASQLCNGWDQTLIYEMHVKGLTKLHPDVPQDLRGTYEGLCSAPILDHLKKLGVTAVQLLPVHISRSESPLSARGLTNYWGYNSIGFFGLQPAYFGPSGRAGFRKMVDTFHDAGIEVILDVVFNHSAESDQLGPTLSFRGLDNASYYRLLPGQQRYYVNDTGCGNALNIAHPFVMRLVLDSMRFWVQVMRVDGFRFDLATALGREENGFDPNARFLTALRQDPILAGTKLIAEPWDIGPGGYQLGNFGPDFAEWNDRFRDTARRFWRGDDYSAQDLGDVLLGTASCFDRDGRRPWSSVNFAAAHDGFTLADTTSYLKRHNLANGEANRDGHHANHSDNFGVEGETPDPQITAKRKQRMRNLLATVFLSQGTPMLLAGDEGGNSQQGNNNAYCQDNETSWINWETHDTDLTEFVVKLSRLRRENPVLRQRRFLHGDRRALDDQKDVEWRSFDGKVPEWQKPDLKTLALILRGNAKSSDLMTRQDEVLIAFNRSHEQQKVCLPTEPSGGWVVILDTADPTRENHEVADVTAVEAQSIIVMVPQDTGAQHAE